MTGANSSGAGAHLGASVCSGDAVLGVVAPKDVAVSGPTWAQIRESLGITKQAAHDFCRRKIEEQEKYLPSFTTRQLRVRS